MVKRNILPGLYDDKVPTITFVIIPTFDINCFINRHSYFFSLLYVALFQTYIRCSNHHRMFSSKSTFTIYSVKCVIFKNLSNLNVRNLIYWNICTHRSFFRRAANIPCLFVFKCCVTEIFFPAFT